METMRREMMDRRFIDELPINGFCDVCGSSVQFHNQQSDRAESGPRDLSNFRVEYIAPTQPEHSFEPYCAILADSALYGQVRVFDVPDPDESQREVAEFACRAMNNLDVLVGALEKARYALKEVAKETRFSGHGLSFPLTVQEIDAALAAVRRD